jgi:hypothetical protein
MLKIIDETFRKNVESNVFSQQMLIPKNVDATCYENVGSTFWLKMLQHFSKMLKHFVIHNYEVAGGKIKYII